MKYLPRIAGLLLGGLLLGVIIASQTHWLTPHPAQLSTSSLAIVGASATAPADDLAVAPAAPAHHTPTSAIGRAPRAATSAPDDAFEVPPKPGGAPRATPAPIEPLDLFIHLPPNAAQHQPLRVLVALHGIGGEGAAFAEPLIPDAERNHWVLVAPTIPYGGWMDHKDLLKDDVRFSHALEASLKRLPEQVPLSVRPEVILYGFSRGAQLAHRFAFFFPARVDTVIAFSAGTYTLPIEKRGEGANAQTVPLPFGVSDCQTYVPRAVDWVAFRKIAFWIAVGGRDNRADEVPRAFDPYIGNNRVDRARSFSSALQKLGVVTHLVIFPNAGHEVTAGMRDEAVKFLIKQEQTESVR